MIIKQLEIEEFIKQLEKFVDLNYKINKETDYCNHSYVIKTLKPEYDSLKKEIEETLKNLVDNNSES